MGLSGISCFLGLVFIFLQDDLFIVVRNYVYIVIDDVKNCFEVFFVCLRYIIGFVCGIIYDRIIYRFCLNVVEVFIVNCSCFD